MSASSPESGNGPGRRQHLRVCLQGGFFVLFIMAPGLDIFRYDLNQGHFIILGQVWSLGLAEMDLFAISPGQLATDVLIKGFLPLALLVIGMLWLAWRFGRLYCGWLCPHFSVLETINRLMIRACGRPSLWQQSPLPQLQPDGTRQIAQRRYWPLVWAAALGFAFLWALTLLTYLLPPAEIYARLMHLTLTPNQFRFLTVGTSLFFIEFMFARHLFCRYGCAVGVFLSLTWMANRGAMLVGFDRQRARLCNDCNNACDNACPMRLQPRTIKRKMFTCTQCSQCISACEQVQAHHHRQALLAWQDGEGPAQPQHSRDSVCRADGSSPGLGR